MRIKVEGRVDYQRIAQILGDLLARSPQGATVHGLNLYLTIRDERNQLVEFTDSQGQAIELLTYNEDRVQVPLRKNGRKAPPKRPQKPNLRVVGGKDTETRQAANSASQAA
jgi:hypothetical protein